MFIIDVLLDDGIETQIATVPLIDINQSSLSLFSIKSETVVSDIDNSCPHFGFDFASRRIATVEFSDYENGKLFGLLNHRDCALTVLLSETQWINSGLENIHATSTSKSRVSSNSTESSRAIKLYIKSSEYENFIKMLKSRGLLVQENESDLNEQLQLLHQESSQSHCTVPCLVECKTNAIGHRFIQRKTLVDITNIGE